MAATLLAHADHSRAGKAWAKMQEAQPELLAEMALAREVAAARRAALRRGEIPERSFRVVEYNGPVWPPGIKNPGRRRRKREARLHRNERRQAAADEDTFTRR
jgi:hypothetical protein